MEVNEIKNNIELILDNNKARSISTIDLKNKNIIFIKNKPIKTSSTILRNKLKIKS